MAPTQNFCGPIPFFDYDLDMFMLLLLLAVVVILVLIGQRCGQAASLKPIPTFDGPIPPHEAIDYDRVVFMPYKDQRPLLVY